MELPGREYLTLVARGERNVLLHRGTGEEQDVDQGCVLRFFPSGAAELLRRDGSSTPCNDILKLRLCSAPRNGEEHEQFVVNTTTGTQTWLSDIVREPTNVRAFPVTAVSERLVSIQVYHFEAGLEAVRGKVWWAMPMVINWLFNTAHGCRYWKQSGQDTMRKAVALAGFMETELRGSRRTTLSLKVRGHEVTDAARNLQYSTASTRALMVCLLSWMDPSKKSRSKEFVPDPEKCQLIIDKLFDVAACEGGFDVCERGDGHVYFRVMEGGLVDMDAMQIQGTWIKYAIKRLQPQATGNMVKARLITSPRCLRLPARCRS